jgi:hypothetical protein
MGSAGLPWDPLDCHGIRWIAMGSAGSPWDFLDPLDPLDRDRIRDRRNPLFPPWIVCLNWTCIATSFEIFVS